MENKLSLERASRVWYLLYGLAFFIGIVVLRLLYLQVSKHSLFTDLGEKNFLRVEVIPPLRGNVFDCRGVLLASNKPVFDVYWQGRGSYSLSSDHITLLRQVEKLLNCSLVENNALVRSVQYAERFGRSYLLKENISFEQLCKLSEQCAHVANLMIKNRFERVYPHKTLASHVVGYLNRTEQIGCSGLEQLFHDHLSGQGGYVKHIINATGKRLKEAEYKNAQAGQDLILTLDSDIQLLAESLFAPNQSGSVIVMDPENGAIKALASYPGFDPNMFLYPISQELWEDKFTTNSPLMNRATRALYPPASIFKLVTLAAGLEEGIYTPEKNFKCNGSLVFKKRKYRCQRHWGHGSLTLKEGLAFSCNIPCFEIAKQLPVDVFASYAYRFGLGQKTKFLLPEYPGLVPTSVWKKSCRGEDWWPGETLSVAIGQSYLLVTPLQQARLISSVFKGYLVKPRLVENEEVEKEFLEISPSTLSFLQDSMGYAVQAGTVRRLKHLKDFEIYAKTGTAQTCSLNKKKISRQDYEHAWLTSFFSYEGKAPLTLVILIEHAGACLPAVQAAEKFLRGYRLLMQRKQELKLDG